MITRSWGRQPWRSSQPRVTGSRSGDSVQNDRDGAVVQKLDLHSRAEDTGLDRDAELA